MKNYWIAIKVRNGKLYTLNLERAEYIEINDRQQVLIAYTKYADYRGKLRISCQSQEEAILVRDTLLAKLEIDIISI